MASTDVAAGMRTRRSEWPATTRPRHTAVALWIAAGASPKAIAVRAGHRSVVTVLDVYGHLLPGTDDALAERLDELYASMPATASAPVRALR